MNTAMIIGITVGIIGLALGILVSTIAVIILPNLCLHRWGRWEEVQGLHITVHDEWGGKTNKTYRRFERDCGKCGKAQLRKKRSG